MEWVILGSVWILAAFMYFALPSYLKEKGKNLATREDVGAITKTVEEIRTQAATEIEQLRAMLTRESEGLARRRDIYQHLTDGMRIFVESQLKDPATRPQRQDNFLRAYASAWLWAPDELIRALNAFILLNMRSPARNDERQVELKRAYYETIVRMRRDAGFPETTLQPDDLLFVQF